MQPHQLLGCLTFWYCAGPLTTCAPDNLVALVHITLVNKQKPPYSSGATASDHNSSTKAASCTPPNPDANPSRQSRQHQLPSTRCWTTEALNNCCYNAGGNIIIGNCDILSTLSKRQGCCTSRVPHVTEDLCGRGRTALFQATTEVLLAVLLTILQEHTP